MDEWKVTFWDVGQGDATDIELPDGEHILIDAGPLSRVGNPLSDWFKDKGNPAIKLCIVTHNHIDHFGGYVSLVTDANQKIEKFILLPDEATRKNPLKGDFKTLLTGLKARSASGRTKVEWACSPQILYSDGKLQLRMLHPQGDPALTMLDANKTSMVIALETVAVPPVAHIVWGADTLLANICKVCGGKSPSILMGPHHGKAQDNLKGQEYWRVFNTQLHPDCIFVSVGRKNPYRHPDRKYIVGASSAGVRVCCSEIADQCDENADHDIFPGSGMLGLPKPPRSFQCRGAMRVFVAEGKGVAFDKFQSQYCKVVSEVYPDSPCKQKRFQSTT